MKDIIEVIVELSRMQGQAIDRAQAEAINTAVEKAHDKCQNEQKDLVD